MPVTKGLVDAHDFQPENLHFDGIRRYKDGNKPYIPASYTQIVNGHTTNIALLLKTPSMPMPFGVGEYQGEKNIDLSFNNPTPEVQAFREKMEAVDTMVFETGVQYSNVFFGRSMRPELLEEMGAHNKIVRLARKEEYGYSMKTKWPKFEPPTFYKMVNGQLAVAQESECKGGCTGKIIMELRPIYFVSGKFGVKWVIGQVLIETSPPTLNTCGFGEIPAAINLNAEEQVEDEEMNADDDDVSD